MLLQVCGRAAGFRGGAGALPAIGGAGAIALRCASAPDGTPAAAALARRDAAAGIAAAAAAGLWAAAPAPAHAFCPPDCKFMTDEQTLEMRKQGLRDAKYIGKKEAAETVAASDADAGPPIDLSIVDQREKTVVTDQAFFDVSVGADSTNTSRIVISLFGDVVPETVRNFKQLVSGEKGVGFRGTNFYRIVKDLQISGGDVLKNGGKTGQSAVNGGVFDQENFRIMHSVPGVVSMQNTIDKQVDSRFFISTRPVVDPGYSKIFDGKYVAFGLITQGMDVVQRLNDLEVNSGFLDKGIKSGRPKQDIIIQACGLLQAPPVPLSAVTAAPLPAGDRGVYSGTRLEK